MQEIEIQNSLTKSLKKSGNPDLSHHRPKQITPTPKSSLIIIFLISLLIFSAHFPNLVFVFISYGQTRLPSTQRAFLLVLVPYHHPVSEICFVFYSQEYSKVQKDEMTVLYCTDAPYLWIFHFLSRRRGEDNMAHQL